jgi:hypothetical protein
MDCSCHLGDNMSIALFGSDERAFSKKRTLARFTCDRLTKQCVENGASDVLIDEPTFATSIRPEPEAIGDIFCFRAHGHNAKAWWNPKESWERYDYLYSRDQVKQHAERIKTSASTPGVRTRLPSTTTTHELMRRRTLSCCLRDWESG